MGYTTGAMSLILTLIILLGLVAGSFFVDPPIFNDLIAYIDLSDVVLASIIMGFVAIQTMGERVR